MFTLKHRERSTSGQRRRIAALLFSSLLLACLLAACSGGQYGAAAESNPYGDMGVALIASDGGVARECEGFTLDEGTFTVAAGGDVQYCVQLPIPEKFQGRDLALTGWDWDLPVGTHHYFMAYSPEPYQGPANPTTPYPCNGTNPIGQFSLLGGVVTNGAKIAFAAGVGKGAFGMNTGYGKYISKGGHFETSHHVVNASNKALVMHAVFHMCMQDASATETLVNSLFATQTDINIPAGQQATIAGMGVAPYDMDVVLLSSHAHMHLQRFQAFLFDGTTTGTTPIYQSEIWDSPAIDYQSPPIHLTQGQGIAFNCLDQAPPNAPVKLAQGGDDQANEHCVLYAGWAYPAGTHAHEIPPPMIAVSSTNGGSAVFTNSTGLPSPF